MFCAGFRPSSTSNSVASAARSPMVGTSARSAAVKFSSTSAAGSLRPAGYADAHPLKSVVPKRPAVNC